MCDILAKRLDVFGVSLTMLQQTSSGHTECLHTLLSAYFSDE